MKTELSIEKQIEEAIKDVQEAMLANLKAGKVEVDAKLAKEKAHYQLLKAKERLTGLERSFM
jgi:hypothetical protein